MVVLLHFLVTHTFVRWPDKHLFASSLDVKSKKKKWDLNTYFMLRKRFHCGCRSITRAYYRNSVGGLLLFDITNRRSFQNVHDWLEEARSHVQPHSIVFLLVGHKCDLEAQRQVGPGAASETRSSRTQLTWFPVLNSPLSPSRWPARKQRSWRGRTGCATWRRQPAMPSTWSTPSPSWRETSSPWCGLATSPSRKAGRAWRAASSPTWSTPRRKWQRATAAVCVDSGEVSWSKLKRRPADRFRGKGLQDLRCQPFIWRERNYRHPPVS